MIRAVAGLAAFAATHGAGQRRCAAVGSFPGMRLTVHDTIVSGDEVVLRFTNSGTQTGELMGDPPSGKHAE